jgi:hypothetical protein
VNIKLTETVNLPNWFPSSPRWKKEFRVLPESRPAAFAGMGHPSSPFPISEGFGNDIEVSVSANAPAFEPPPRYH